MDKERTTLSGEERDRLLESMEVRFAANMVRHKGIMWENVKKKLVANEKKLRVLYAMEATGGEPDVVFYDNQQDTYLFMDCSPESPKGRRNVCYDWEALEGRKENKPHHNAMGMALEMGMEMLTEEQYRELQKIGEFDLKTSSWVKTPAHIRKLGAAIFCDRRYDTVFVYHNSAESYYGVRGFRGCITV